MINSIILSGHSEKELSGYYNKGLIDIYGKPMINYVIDALRASKVIDQIAIVGHEEDFQGLDLDNRTIIIDNHGDPIDNMTAGIEYFNKEARVLITTCDIPLLTGEAVKDFVNQSLCSNADVCYPIIDKSTSENEYPDAKRTYARLKEGFFTGGNLFIINPAVMERSIDKAKQMVTYRKNPMKMSRVLGFRFLIRFLLGRLTIERAEKRVSNILDIFPKAIISMYPGIGNDVDKPEDLDMVKKYIQKR